jgi:hypothetical protein
MLKLVVHAVLKVKRVRDINQTLRTIAELRYLELALRNEVACVHTDMSRHN